MRKSIKESTIRKIIRREILKEAEGKNKKKPEGNKPESQFDQRFNKAIELTSNLDLDENLVSFLKNLLHIFIIGSDPKESAKLGKTASLNKLAAEVIDSWPGDKQSLSRILRSLLAVSNSSRENKE